MPKLIMLRRVTLHNPGGWIRHLEMATTSNHAKPEGAINMAYASYENTQTKTDQEPCPVVIMHGLFGSKANWHTLSKHIHDKTNPQRKVITVDARNHGDSPHTINHSYNELAEDIKMLLETLKIGKVAFIGHSMGGRAGMPNLVEKLIVVDISPFSNTIDLKGTSVLMAAMLKIVLSKNASLSTARMSADMQLSRSISNKAIRSFLLSNLIQKSDGGFAWRVNLQVLLKNFNNILKFPEINSTYQQPALFLGGALSNAIPEADYTKIQKLFPKTEFKIIQGAGHWVHSEKPKEFLDLCFEFLNRKLV